jgi:Ni/Fe-hydrogenase subunit HybB-like protein
MFYMSAIPAGLCMVIIACYLSVRSLGVKMDYGILIDLAKMCVPMLSIYAIFRFVDLLTHGSVPYMFQWRSETAYFWAEILLMIAVPIFLFTRKKVLETPMLLYWTSCIEAMGFMMNRLNISITAMEYTNHANYVPKWPEVMITMMVVAAAVVVFRLCVLYLEVFPRATAQERWLSAPASA